MDLLICTAITACTVHLVVVITIFGVAIGKNLQAVVFRAKLFMINLLLNLRKRKSFRALFLSTISKNVKEHYYCMYKKKATTTCILETNPFSESSLEIHCEERESAVSYVVFNMNAVALSLAEDLVGFKITSSNNTSIIGSRMRANKRIRHVERNFPPVQKSVILMNCQIAEASTAEQDFKK